MEYFRDVIGYDGLYMISNLGNVYSVKRGKNLKPGTLRNGYLIVVLSNNGRKRSHSVHRLVAEAFIPNPNNLPDINHKDEDKTNNTVYNLEWCDKFYNQCYSHGKRVQQLSNGNVIAEYASIKDAARCIGAAHAGISACCNGRLSHCKGYEWRFADGK